MSTALVDQDLSSAEKYIEAVQSLLANGKAGTTRRAAAEGLAQFPNHPWLTKKNRIINPTRIVAKPAAAASRAPKNSSGSANIATDRLRFLKTNSWPPDKNLSPSFTRYAPAVSNPQPWCITLSSMTLPEQRPFTGSASYQLATTAPAPDPEELDKKPRKMEETE